MEKFSKLEIIDFITTSGRILEKITSELKYISVISEKEFTLVSDKLQQYYSSSKETNNTASALAQTLSGKNFYSEIKKLSSISVEIFSSISSTNNRFINSNKNLEQIIGLINSTTNEVLNFSRLVKYLRVQGIATKIESARLGSNDAGFSQLAENVEKLSTVIAEKTIGFRDKAAELIRSINEVKMKTIELEKAGKEHSDSIEENTGKSLNALVKKYELSSDKSKVISRNFDEIRKRIGEVVTSV